MSRRGVPADGFATGRPCDATQPIRPAPTFWAQQWARSWNTEEA
jgi:hypothetical protein